MTDSKFVWLAALIFGLACGAEEPPAPAEVVEEPPEEVVAEAPEEPEAPEELPIMAEPGTLVGGPGTLPEGFPGDIPYYPNSRTTKLGQFSTAGGMLFLSADSEPDQVYEFYVEELAARGWKIQATDVEDGETWSIRATKAGRSVFVSIGFDYDDGEGASYGIAHDG